jgi:hypothetical protein
MSILQKKKIDIPEPKDYDFSNTDNDIKSCGLEHKTFGERNKNLFNDFVVDASKQNVVALLCDRMERSFSKRELAFLLAKNTLLEHMKQEQGKAMKSSEAQEKKAP